MVELKDKDGKKIELKNILYICRDSWTRWTKENQKEKSRVWYYYNTRNAGEPVAYVLESVEGILGSEYCEILESMPEITKFEYVKQPTKVICAKYKNPANPFYYIERSGFISLNEKLNGGDPNISEIKVVIPGTTPANPDEIVKLNLRETFSEENAREFFENQIKIYGDLEHHEEKDAYVELPQLILEFSDGRGFKFKSQAERNKGIIAMQKDQEFMKTPEYARIRGKRPTPVVNPRVSLTPMTPEEEARALASKKEKSKTTKITLAIIAGALVLVSIIVYNSVILVKNIIGKKDDQDLSPTFTPTIEAKVTPEPSPTSKTSSTPTIPPKRVYKTGEDFINELREKNYKYLINGDAVEFTAEKAENLFKLLEGKHDEVFEGLSDSEKRQAIDEYKQIMMLYCSEAFDIDSKGPVDLSDYCDIDVTLYEKIAKTGRELVVLAKDQPLNGAELNSKASIGDFSDDYIKAAGSFVGVQTSFVKESTEYEELNNWYRFFLGTMLVNGNKDHVPEYFYIIKKGTKIFNISFEYKDENGKTIELQPIMTNNGVRFENRNTGKYSTLEEVEIRMDPQSNNYDPSMETTGIAAKTTRDREEADKAIFAEEGLTYPSSSMYK